LADAKKDDKGEGKPAKKGGIGKLLVIVVVALVLAGGGYFMMSHGKDTKHKGTKKVELGEGIPLKELLVNLSDGQTYLKTEIGLVCLKDFSKDAIDKNSILINDAIIMRLKSKSPQDLSTQAGLKLLKRQLCADINSVLPKKDDDADDGSADPKKDAPLDADYPYDSKSGPVMKVLFNSFATQ